MAKWYVGMILAIVVIIGTYMAMMLYPWFSIETEYPANSPVETVQVTFSLKEYEIESPDELMDIDPPYPPIEEGTYKINSDPEEGGWDGEHSVYENSGRPEQLKVYKNTFTLMIITIIVAIACVVLIPLAGLGKIPTKAAIAVAIIMTVFAILGPIYYGVFMPFAFDDDSDRIYDYTSDALLATNASQNITQPESLQSIWGDSNNIDVYRQVGVNGAESHWRPALGWWIAIIMIFLSIISIGMIDGPRKGGRYAGTRPHDDYYGDRREDWEEGPPRDDRGRPPPGQDDYYDDRYPPPRDDYQRGGAPPPRGRDYDYDRGPPPQDPSYGRPPPGGPPGAPGRGPPPGAPGRGPPPGAPPAGRPPGRPPDYDYGGSQPPPPPRGRRPPPY